MSFKESLCNLPEVCQCAAYLCDNGNKVIYSVCVCVCDDDLTGMKSMMMLVGEAVPHKATHTNTHFTTAIFDRTHWGS